MYTLLFSVIKKEVEIGKVFVTGCPDLDLSEELLEFGDNGYKFLEIVEAIYGPVDKVELLTTSESSQIPHHDENTCVVAWKLAYIC